MTKQTSSKPKRRYARVQSTPTDKTTATKTQNAGAPPRETKIDQVIALLQRTQGATLAEIVQATGWQPHSARAALTGLKKKGHVIAKSKRDDATCYHITEAARCGRQNSMRNWLRWRHCRWRSFARDGQRSLTSPCRASVPACCAWLLHGRCRPRSMAGCPTGRSRHWIS